MSQINVKSEEELNKKIAQIEDDRLEDVAKKVAEDTGNKYLSLRFFPVDNKVLALVDEKIAKDAQVAAIAKISMAVTLAVQDPENELTKHVIEVLKKKGFTVHIVVVSAHSLERVWERYNIERKIDDMQQGIMNINEEEITSFQAKIRDIGDLKDQIVSLPITNVLNALIAGALNIGASDVHFEPQEKQIRLRYRLDGVLTDVVSFSISGYPSLLSRIKLQSGLKINIHQSPQDGRFTIRLHNKDIEVRVSILPGTYGENIVMRILDPSSIRQQLEDLGMREDTLELVKKLLARTSGTILTTGPTGSGKTTTLYAFVQKLNTTDVKVITIEDPVEYHIQGISQTQVSESAGYTFAEGLRSIVRQDPDVILVGEIRDKETAEIAMQAALTGHLVLSTLHTNDAAGTVPRLIDLGVKPVTIGPALHAAMAQRLVRRLCDHCKKKEKIHPEDFAVMNKHLSKLQPTVEAPPFSESSELYYPGACNQCHQTGYRGRIGVFEVFEVDDDMQKLILKSPALAEVKEMAVEKGLTTLLQDAFIKVALGRTSFEEVMRVIGE